MNALDTKSYGELIVKYDALVYALRRARKTMKKQKWSWDELESYIGGSMSLFLDVNDILNILRGDSEMPETLKLLAKLK